MFIRKLTTIIAALACGVLMTTAAAADLPIAKKIELQAAMQRYIDAHLIDGAIIRVDPDTGALRRYTPAGPHPNIVEVGKFFVLCADFRDENGKVVNFDFFLAPGKHGPVVFQAAIDDPQPLVMFMRASG